MLGSESSTVLSLAKVPRYVAKVPHRFQSRERKFHNSSIVLQNKGEVAGVILLLCVINFLF